MWKVQTLRLLVNERLSAVAEEICALFEKTITEFEEELCRSNDENQRRLQSVINPRGELHILAERPGSTRDHGLDQGLEPAQDRGLNPGLGPGLDPELDPRINSGLDRGLNRVLDRGLDPELDPRDFGTVQIKEEPEEQCFKQEEQLSVSEFDLVRVKTEEPSLLQQESRDETQDLSPETYLQPHSDHDYDWGPFSCTGGAASHYYHHQAWSRNQQTAASNTNQPPKTQSAGLTPNRDVSGPAERAESWFHCCFCQRKCRNTTDLKVHLRIHTDRPYSCLICRRTFTRTSHLQIHMRTHSGEKPYSCSICQKNFSDKSNLKKHITIHTRVKPFSCPVCEKTFLLKHQRDRHASTHKGFFSDSKNAQYEINM